MSIEAKAFKVLAAVDASEYPGSGAAFAVSVDLVLLERRSTDTADEADHLIIAMDLNGLDEMKRDLKALTRQMALTLEGEMKTLKLKATRCALHCFQGKAEFREALKCERTCQMSVKRMKEFMEAKTQPVQKRLQKCLLVTEQMIEGVEVKDTSLDSPITCYDSFKKDLAKAQNDIVLEFSYFE